MLSTWKLHSYSYLATWPFFFTITTATTTAAAAYRQYLLHHQNYVIQINININKACSNYQTTDRQNKLELESEVRSPVVASSLAS